MKSESNTYMDELLALMLEATSDSHIIGWDQEHRFAFLNNSAASELGKDAEQLTGQPLNDYLSHPLVEAALKVEQFQQSGKTGLIKFTLDRAGETRWYEGRFSSRTGGKILVASDITQAVKAEQSSLLYENIVNTSNDMMVFLDKDYVIHAANDTYLKLIGKQRDEVIGLTAEELRGKSYFESVVKPVIDKCLQGEDQVFEKDMPTPDGNSIKTKAHYLPFRDSQGEITGVVLVIHDISLEKEVQKRLAGAQEDQKRFLKLSQDLICVADINGYFKKLNPAFFRILGFSEKELKSRPFLDFVHPDDHAATGVALSVLDAGNTITAFENRCQCKNGEYRWLQWNAVLDKDSSSVFAIARDITQRKSVDQSLRDSETRYRELITNMSNGVAVYSAVNDGEDFIFREMNPAGLRIGQLDRDQVIGKSVLAVYPGIKEMGLFEVFQRVNKTGETEHFPLSVYKDERFTQWVENTVCRLPSGEIMAVYEDVTERHNVLERLYIQDRALASTRNGVIINKAEENFPAVYVNKAYEKLTGCTRDKMVGESCNLLQQYDSNDVELQKIRQALSVGDSLRATLRKHGKNGELFYHNLSLSPVRDKLGELTHYIGILEDVTARKRLESELQQAHKMEALGQLTGGIAHDFNNILASIIGFADLTHRTHKTISAEKLKHYSEVMLESGQRARDLIAQMLLFSRPDSIKPGPMDLVPQVKEITKLLHSTLPASISINLEIEPDLPKVNIQPVHIQQILMNLCVNARDAMNNKGLLKISLADEHYKQRDCDLCGKFISGRWVVLSVSDNGSGIDQTIAGKIFDPFFTTRENTGGTGLGLSVIHQLVRSHGGHVLFDTEPGKGSTFNILLPEAVNEVEPVKDPVTHHPQPTRKGEHILVVDDEPMITEFLSELLQAHGYRVSSFTSSKDAQSTYQSDPDDFNLIITDRTMPQLNGEELITSLKKLRPDFPAILCTGNSVDVEGDELNALGINQFMVKPINSDELLKNIEQVLATSTVQK